MELETYKIRVTETKIAPEPNFKKFATNASFFKIYIVKYKSDILYVGMTKQRISKRFYQSFRNSKTKAKTGKASPRGDSGYKWILEHKNKDLKLFVFAFTKEENERLIKAIEAEIVFIIRKETDLWPECQNEIHFNNDYKKAKVLALEIFNQIIL